MWKQKPISLNTSASTPPPEPVRTVSAAPVADAARPRAMAVGDQAVISKGLVIQGEITGVDPLFIDGTVEGTIHIAAERVTVGRQGYVVANKSLPAPCITAREIVILGRVTGNVVALERLEIRAEGSLSGDVSTARVSIEDGAFFRGGIDIRRDDSKAELPAQAVLELAETR